MNRRSFLATILAAATAPAIVRAETLMVVRRPPLIGVCIPYILGPMTAVWIPDGLGMVRLAPAEFGAHLLQARSQFDLERKIAEFRKCFRSN